jgi:isopenicillin-N epimerase
VREHFLLDPSVNFLNHGSFGACPADVFAVYQRWQRELEFQPVEFIGRRLEGLLREAMAPLARYINAPHDACVFVSNATAGVNVVARSLKLQPGDEVLATDHEYGACSFTWTHVCNQAGASYILQPISVPILSEDAFIKEFWAGVTPRTKVIFISHITSATGLIFPIARLIQRARAAGILTVIDGAHVPSHIPLDLTALDPDFYTGNFHKWMCAPKSSAFLYARPDKQHLLTPLTISWGYGDPAFTVQHERQPTRDPSAYLATPDALAWLQAHDWDTHAARCHEMILQARERISQIGGQAPLAPPDWYGQMVACPLPPCDVAAVKTLLYDKYRIEIPVFLWNNMPIIRISVQAYNTQADLDAFYSALGEVLKIAAIP